MIYDDPQVKVTLTIVSFNWEARQPIHLGHLEGREGRGEDSIEDCVFETQNLDQLSSQFLDIVAILANMMDGGGDNTSCTPTFKHPRLGEANSPLMNEECSTYILKHIGLMEEEDLEVFVDALDDRLVPTRQLPREPTKIGLCRSFSRVHRPPPPGTQGAWRPHVNWRWLP